MLCPTFLLSIRSLCLRLLREGLPDPFVARPAAVVLSLLSFSFNCSLGKCCFDPFFFFIPVKNVFIDATLIAQALASSEFSIVGFSVSRCEVHASSASDLGEAWGSSTGSDGGSTTSEPSQGPRRPETVLPSCFRSQGLLRPTRTRLLRSP